MKNGLETENWVYEARVEDPEKMKWKRNVFEAQVVYKKTLPSPGLGMALSSDWELCWPYLCSPSPRDQYQACMQLFVTQSKVLMGVRCFLSREFPISEYAGEKAGHALSH